MKSKHLPTLNHPVRQNRAGMSSLQIVVLISIASVVLISITLVNRQGSIWMNDNVDALQRVTSGVGSGGGTTQSNARTPVPATPSKGPLNLAGSALPTRPVVTQIAAGNNANPPKSSAGSKNSGPVTVADVKKTIDSVGHLEKSLGDPLVTNSVEFNRIVPANTKTKSRKYRELQKANRGVIAAEKALENATTDKQKVAAQKRLDIAQKIQASKLEEIRTFMKGQISRNPDVKLARAATKKAELEKRKLVRSGASPADIAKAEEAVEQAKENEARVRRELENAIDNFDPLVNIPKTRHVIDIDGEKVTLTDVVDTPYTNDWNTMQGKSKGHGLEHVREQLAATGMSDDRQRIFAGIVKSEASKGGFTQFQSWDRGKVTWGFAQFTLGTNGNFNISKILANIKKQNPDVFKERFQKFGIDVSTTGNQSVIQVTRPDGTKLSGAQAADFLRTAPKQAAALIVAGKDPVVQQAQIAFANKMISNQLNRQITIKGTDKAGNATSNKIRLEDVMTSEYGVGVLADRTINAGGPRTYNTAKQELEKYIKKHNLDPNDVSSWAADAEKAVISKLEQSAVSARIRNLKSEGLSREPGSFDG